jgi:hypothetical protein
MGGEYARSQGFLRGNLDTLYRSDRVLFSAGAIEGRDSVSVASDRADAIDDRRSAAA